MTESYDPTPEPTAHPDDVAEVTEHTEHTVTTTGTDDTDTDAGVDDDPAGDAAGDDSPTVVVPSESTYVDTGH